MSDPHVSHGRPSPRTLEEAIRDTARFMLRQGDQPGASVMDLLILANQISIMEVLRGMQVIQREPR